MQLGRLSLEHDRDYDVDKRSGWSVVHGGSVMVQFVSFPRAVAVLAREWWRGPWSEGNKRWQ